MRCSFSTFSTQWRIDWCSVLAIRDIMLYLHFVDVETNIWHVLDTLTRCRIDWRSVPAVFGIMNYLHRGHKHMAPEQWHQNLFLVTLKVFHKSSHKDGHSFGLS